MTSDPRIILDTGVLVSAVLLPRSVMSVAWKKVAQMLHQTPDSSAVLAGAGDEFNITGELGVCKRD